MCSMHHLLHEKHVTSTVFGHHSGEPKESLAECTAEEAEAARHALDQLHRHNILHDNLHPSNVCFSRNRPGHVQARLVDMKYSRYSKDKNELELERGILDAYLSGEIS